MFTTRNNEPGRQTHAGQHRDGHAYGLGVPVATWSDGSKDLADSEHGPDGKFDGRCFDRYADEASFYRLYERGNCKEFADVLPSGLIYYNGVCCAPDDPRRVTQ